MTVQIWKPGGDLLRSYAITHRARPWTLNRERSGHLHAHRKLTAEWRAAFGWLGQSDPRIPVFQACEIEVEVTVNRHPVADTGACVGAVKAAIDGLVDARRLPHDGPTVVRRLIFNAPQRTGVDSVTLFVRELEP